MARFLLALILLGAVIAGVGFYLGWFHLGIREEKIQRDLATVKEKAREAATEVEQEAKALGREAKNLGDRAGEAVKTVADTKTAKGTVRQVEAADHRLVVQTTDGQEMTVYTDAASKVRQGDRTLALADVRVGDEVTVAYRVNQGKNYAASVTVQRP